MKLKYYCLSLLLGGSLSLGGCTSWLDEDVYSQLDDSTVANSANAIERVLFEAYRNAQFHGNFGGNIEFQEEWTCDQFWETGGAVNNQASVMLQFTWDASYPDQAIGLWDQCYRSIRNCNLVLELVEGSSLSDTEKARFKAEARFIRAIVYYKLYMRCGGVPLRVKSGGEQFMAKATDEEMKTFIATELSEIALTLPERGKQAGYQYGRATRGAAYGFLCKLYLNTRQWDKCAQAAQDLMDLSFGYALWNDYNTLFTVDNERVNKEFIWAYTCSTQAAGNELMNGSFPADFKSVMTNTAVGEIVWTSNMRNWARMDRIYDSFYHSFDARDKRKDLIITEYKNSKGATVSLLNADNTRMFKYVPDPNAVENAHGNDIPVIRYADILLSRAEALNELNGPTDEVMTLIWQVRNRAGMPEILKKEDFTKESVRELLLKERGWEFYGENLRRQDLLRHDKFIEYAKARQAKGKPFEIKATIDDHFKLFPIPQTEVDANPLCKQNTGY